MKKFCLITGASRGLGAFLAKRFWSNGFSLHLVSSSLVNLLETKYDLPRKDDQECFLHICDLSNKISVQELSNNLAKTIGNLSVLVNNAAIQGPIGPLEMNDLVDWLNVIQVNLFAPVVLCKELIPLIKAAGGGSIINMSGGGATGPRANFSSYATAKAGLVRFSETIAEELKPSGVRVNCIAPGAMKTDMLAEVLRNGDIAGDRERALATKVFEEGGASMDRVADLALFLASDASKGITGKLISAVWDDWEHWPEHVTELTSSDAYTLRRITGRDRGFDWGDK